MFCIYSVLLPPHGCILLLLTCYYIFSNQVLLLLKLATPWNNYSVWVYLISVDITNSKVKPEQYNYKYCDSYIQYSMQLEMIYIMDSDYRFVF